MSYIGNSAFYNCYGITSVIIPESVTRLGGYAFSTQNHKTITTVQFNAINCRGNGWYDGNPEGDDYAWTIDPIFYGRSIKSFEIGSTVTRLPSGILAYTDINHISIPENVTTIEDNAFERCTNLTSLSLPASLQSIGSAFIDCTGLTMVNFADVESICRIGGKYNDYYRGGYVNPLKYAKNLYIGGKLITDLVIPSTVTTIGKSTFEGCTSLTSVVFPASITEINDKAFLDCLNIKSVTCLGNVPPSLEKGYYYDDWDDKVYIDRVFSNTGATLRVPSGSIANTYRNSNWSTYFKTIEEIFGILTVISTGNGAVLYDNLTTLKSGEQYIGTDFTFIILPDDNNHVASITLEGEDITKELINHKLTISDFKGENGGKLRINFEPDGEALLTIKSTDNHTITHTHKEGTSATVLLQPEEDWDIHSVTFNNEDVTEKLNQNTFVTGPLHGQNFLNVVLVNSTTTEINNVESNRDNIQISINGNTIAVNGLEENDPITIYDISGKTIYTGFQRIISLNHDNVYILTTPHQTYKIAL